MKIQYFIGDIVSVITVQGKVAVISDVTIRRNGTTYRWNSQKFKNISKGDIVEYHLYYIHSNIDFSKMVKHCAEDLKLVEGGPFRKILENNTVKDNDEHTIAVYENPDSFIWQYSSVSEHKVPNRCPICNGTGLVSRPPGIAGDVEEWTSTGTGPYTCNACGGTGIIWS